MAVSLLKNSWGELAMAPNKPVQERSLASMNRMLDAGEQLFFEGGSPALTLEEVIKLAETSTGSFMHDSAICAASSIPCTSAC